MTFDRLKVQDFQSIAKADLELGSFTVIVGPSNSGKSAVLRAVKAVVRNVTSPSSVRVGQKMFTAALSEGDRLVAVERGKSHSTYKVIDAGEEKAYTKAGRSVPVEVQHALGIMEPEGPDLVFSSQIDPPFLLAETGSTAAKMLGDLTNVSKLHAAAREANKRRLDASRLIKVRQADAQECSERLAEIVPGLKEESDRLSEARGILEKVRTQAHTVEALRGVLESLQRAEKFFASCHPLPPEPADVDAAVKAVFAMIANRSEVEARLFRLGRFDAVVEEETENVRATRTEAEELEERYHALLEEAGTCPMCGKPYTG